MSHIGMNYSYKGGLVALRFGQSKHPSSLGAHKMVKVQFITGYIRVLHAAAASNKEPAFLWLEFYDKNHTNLGMELQEFKDNNLEARAILDHVILTEHFISVDAEDIFAGFDLSRGWLSIMVLRPTEEVNEIEPQFPLDIKQWATKPKSMTFQFWQPLSMLRPLFVILTQLLFLHAVNGFDHYYSEWHHP